MNTAAVHVVALLATLTVAACDQTSNSDRCRAIGETRESALQPDDRLYWEKNCQEYRAVRREDELNASARAEGYANWQDREERQKQEKALDKKVKERMSRKCYDGNSMLLTPKCKAEYDGLKTAGPSVRPPTPRSNPATGCSWRRTASATDMASAAWGRAARRPRRRP